MDLRQPTNWFTASANTLTWREWSIGIAATILLRSLHTEPTPEEGEPMTAAVALTLLVLSVGLSLLAGYLLAKKNKDLVPEDKPTVLSKRASYTVWQTGLARLDNVTFGWAGERFSRKEKAEGGKGGLGSSPKVDVWYESGWHQLGPGPLEALHEIRQNGEIIFSGPITRQSHPSGSFIDLGGEGGFIIYWGEESQPINTYLGNSERLDISSRWPFMAGVVWVGKRLGQQPNWAILDYVTEQRPNGNHLSLTEPWVDPTRVLDGPTNGIFAINAGGEGIGYFEIQGDVASDYKPQGIMRLTGNAAPDQDLEVLVATVVIIEISPPDPPNYMPGIYETRTRVFPRGGLPVGADDQGTLQAYTLQADSGINIAHGWAGMLYDPWPRGLGLPKGQWDMDSLEQIGVLTGLGGEDLRCFMQGSGGADAESVLGSSLQDMGVMVPIDTVSGLLKFFPVRDPSGQTLQRIREELLQGNLPQIKTQHIEQPVDRIVFAFPDRLRNHRTQTLAEQANGSIAYQEFARQRTVPIVSTNVLDTAGKIVSRRAQEELAGAGTTVKMRISRAGREILPGSAIVVDVLDTIMRVEDMTIDIDAECVSFNLQPDYTGASKSTFEHPDPPFNPSPSPVQPDLAIGIIEVPELLLSGGLPTVLVPRIRANTSVSSADLHLSNDNITYTLEGTEFNPQTGGTLVSDMTAIDCSIFEDGPEIDVLGPDLSTILDLSSDTGAWLSGRQLAVINNEIFFLRNVTITGPTTIQLHGLIRAVYSTKRRAHAAGDNVFIFANDSIFNIQDIVLLQPSRPIFAKTAPKGNGQIPISQVAPASGVIVGFGINPAAISALRVELPYLGVPGYQTGETVCFAWGFATPKSPGSGAGMSPAGEPVGGSLPEGGFLIEILDAPGTSVMFTTTSVLATFQYTQAQRLTHLGGEVNFQIRVTQLRDGLSSQPVVLPIEKF